MAVVGGHVAFVENRRSSSGGMRRLALFYFLYLQAAYCRIVELLVRVAPFLKIFRCYYHLLRLSSFVVSVIVVYTAFALACKVQ